MALVSADAAGTAPNSRMASSLEEAKAAFKRRCTEVKVTAPKSDPGPV
jgi:hypothetical protein